MIVIAPSPVVPPADVVATNIPADDAYPAWSSVTRYAVGDVVTTGSGEARQVWQAAYAQAMPAESGSSLPVLYNEARAPATAIIPAGYKNAGALWWREATGDPYFENRYRMFSDNPAVVTTSPVDILVEVKSPEPWSAFALFNIGADELSAELLNGPAEWSVSLTLRYADPLSADFPNRATAAFADLPEVDPVAYPNARLKMRLWATVPRIIHCGALVLGSQTRIGKTLFGTEVGIIDYSRKERDPFGNMLIIERGYTDLVRYRFEIDTPTIAAARQFLADRRAKVTVFIGTTEHPESIVYGWYKDLLLPVESHQVSVADLEVESIVQDVPASTSALPSRTVFVHTNGDACITEDLGASAELCISGGKIVGRVFATVLDYTLAEGDSLAWEMSWLSGTSAATFSVTGLTTDCDQTLSVLFFPGDYQPEQTEPAVAAIRAVITLADESVIWTEPAILSLKVCDDCDPGAPPPEPCCVPAPEAPVWLPSAETEAVAIVRQYVVPQAPENPDPPEPPEPPEEPDPPPPISCQVICYYLNTRTGGWEYFGSSGGIRNASYGQFFVAVRQVGGSEAYLPTSSYSLSVEGAAVGSSGGGPHGINGWYVNGEWSVNPHHFTVSVTVNDPPGSTCSTGSFWWGL